MKHLYTIIFFFFAVSVSAQSWTIKSAAEITTRGSRDIVPDKYIIAATTNTEMKDLLWSAPAELTYQRGTTDPYLINVMLADRTIDQFEIVQYDMMEPRLSARYPNTRTYRGVSIKNPLRRIRLSYTGYGMRAIVTEPSGQTYIDHYQRGDMDTKIIYKRDDYSTIEDWVCKYDEINSKYDASQNRSNDDASSQRFSGDCVFRSYRFAVTATGEYSNFHGATSAAQSNLVLDAVVVTVNRINDVFEQDITTRFVLIGNNDDIFYYDSSTDPFTGNSSSAMINQNQTNTDAVIGSANYDLGHIFSTGGSGLAQTPAICGGGKARGVTGIGNPVGDPFDIDYVAHEVGHQLGAGHTQNNNCNVSGFSAREPGSASTIMGYAGICAPNVQNNSDAYFHAISIQQMNATIIGTNCDVELNLNNSAPVVDPLINKAIPHSTPFVLDVNATDVDTDPLTYNWEQMNNETGQTMPPAGTNTAGPIFRSKFATAESARYFPPLANVVAGTTPTWEVLPTVERTMNFRVTVRDHAFAPGCTDESDIQIEVTDQGPFEITTQNDATTWTETEVVTITWDVAGTNNAPVNCANVDIVLSYDGGNTFITTLASNTPNDGSTRVTVPTGATNQGRIIVRCSDNVFYDVNDQNISIVAAFPSYSFNLDPTSSEVCTNETETIEILTTSINSYAQPINMSITGLPPGASASFSQNPVVPGMNTSLVITDLDNALGSYNIEVTGSTGSQTKTRLHTMRVFATTSVTQPILLQPSDAATGVPNITSINWASVANVQSYDYQISASPQGQNLVATGNTTATSADVTNLGPQTTYYWRVRSVTLCTTSDWSMDFSFETAPCLTFPAADLPIDISASGTPTITSQFSIAERGDITDLNIVALGGSHSWISDLEFTLIGPDNTEVLFWDRPCDDENNFSINFDDEAANNSWPCPPVNQGTYIPDASLSAYNSKTINGVWQLAVRDLINQDGGSLDSWALELCIDNYCDITVDKIGYSAGAGSLEKAIECAIDGDTIILESNLANLEINSIQLSTIIDKNIVILANRADNITLASEGDAPTIEIAAGATVSLIGFDIKNVDTSDGVILNNGTLIIENINVLHSSLDVSVINAGTGTLTVKGDCEITGG